MISGFGTCRRRVNTAHLYSYLIDGLTCAPAGKRRKGVKLANVRMLWAGGLGPRECWGPLGCTFGLE